MMRSIWFAIAAFAACGVLGLSLVAQLLVTVVGAVVGAIGA